MRPKPQGATPSASTWPGTPAVRNELILLAERIGRLHNDDALKVLDLCRKVVAGFELKGSIQDIGLNDLVQLGLSLSGNPRR